MTNAVLFGSSGSIGSIKGTEDIFRVQKGCIVKKGDFLTYDYYSFESGIESNNKRFVRYSDEVYYPTGNTKRTFSTYGLTSKEIVVRNACITQNGVCSQHSIVAVALDNGNSLEAVRVKKVNHNVSVDPGASMSSSDWSKFQSLYSEAKSQKLFGVDLLNYINAGMGYN